MTKIFIEMLWLFLLTMHITMLLHIFVIHVMCHIKRREHLSSSCHVQLLNGSQGLCTCGVIYASYHWPYDILLLLYCGQDFCTMLVFYFGLALFDFTNIFGGYLTQP